MNGLLYKGYTASLEVLLAEGFILGRLDGIPDTITFKVNSINDVQERFREAVDEFLEDCKEMGRTPPKPCSGSIQFRVSPSLHAAAMSVAQSEFSSFNKFGESILKAAVEKRFPNFANSEKKDLQTA